MLLVIPSQPPLDIDEMDRHIDLHEALAVQERRPAVEASLQNLLSLTPSTVVRLRDHLDNHRLLTTRLDIQQPQYVWVTVQTRIKTLPKRNQSGFVMPSKQPYTGSSTRSLVVQMAKVGRSGEF